jgi:hypothetical protein
MKKQPVTKKTERLRKAREKEKEEQAWKAKNGPVRTVSKQEYVERKQQEGVDPSSIQFHPDFDCEEVQEQTDRPGDDSTRQDSEAESSRPVPHPTSGATTKTCKRDKCKMAGEPQPFTNFYKNPNSKDGHEAVCRTCKIEKQRARRQHKKPRSTKINPYREFPDLTRMDIKEGEVKAFMPWKKRMEGKYLWYWVKLPVGHELSERKFWNFLVKAQVGIRVLDTEHRKAYGIGADVTRAELVHLAETSILGEPWQVFLMRAPMELSRAKVRIRNDTPDWDLSCAPPERHPRLVRLDEIRRERLARTEGGAEDDIDDSRCQEMGTLAPSKTA